MAKAAQRVIIERTGTELAASIAEAGGFLGSFMGLMFKPTLPDGTGMIFRPAMGIHTLFMRFAIDLVYLDKDDAVKKIRPAVAPWRLDFTSAAACIELNAAAAAAAGLQKGDRLLFTSATP